MSAPAQIAVQARRLSTSTAQRASPEGGHAGLTCSATSAARNPSFAAADIRGREPGEDEQLARPAPPGPAVAGDLKNAQRQVDPLPGRQWVIA